MLLWLRTPSVYSVFLRNIKLRCILATDCTFTRRLLGRGKLPLSGVCGCRFHRCVPVTEGPVVPRLGTGRRWERSWERS